MVKTSFKGRHGHIGAMTVKETYYRGVVSVLEKLTFIE